MDYLAFITNKIVENRDDFRNTLSQWKFQNEKNSLYKRLF